MNTKNLLTTARFFHQNALKILYSTPAWAEYEFYENRFKFHYYLWNKWKLMNCLFQWMNKTDEFSFIWIKSTHTDVSMTLETFIASTSGWVNETLEISYFKKFKSTGKHFRPSNTHQTLKKTSNESIFVKMLLHHSVLTIWTVNITSNIYFSFDKWF